MGIRLKLFFAQLFLLISSVSTEQSQICVVNTGSVEQERRDPSWQDNLTHSSSQQVCWWQHSHLRPKILHKKICCKSTKNEAERVSQHHRLFKICTDAGFLTTVEVGQYFMTRDTEEFSQFTEPVTCREYTLPRDEKSSDPKVWIQGNTKIGPVLEVTTSYLQGKHGVEIRNESVNKDNSHSWVRISHGLNKLVTDLIDKEYDDNEQETSETKSEEFALKTNVFALEADQRLKQNQEDLPLLVHQQELYLIVKEFGLMLSQELDRISLTQWKKTDCSSSSWSLHREEDEAI